MNQFPFFVYGTLLPGQPNFGLWGDAIVSLSPARILGAVLYDLDWYPMLIDLPGSEVTGLVVDVEPSRYAAVMSRLDFLEGYDPAEPDAGEYRRELRIVTLSGGSQRIAWVYVGHAGPVGGRSQLTTSWTEHARRQRPQLAEWWQEIDTVAGLVSDSQQDS